MGFSFADVETALNGNSGNPATSQKMSNLVSEQVRGASSGSSTTLNSQIQMTQVQASNSSVGQPPSLNSTLASGPTSNGDDTSIPDTYRYSDDPESTPARQLGEVDSDTTASISVKAYDGTDIISGFTSFFLQSVSEAEQEKYQVVETFTAYYVFFFGKRPPIYRYSGMLLNDPDQNWMNTFRVLYEDYFRGTSAADLNAQAIMTYDKRTVSGFLLGLTIQQEAQNDKGVPFSFDMLVIDHSLVGFSTDFDQFIATQQQRLQNLRDQAAQDIASLNQDTDSFQNILKNSVLKGALPTGSVQKIDQVLTPRPETTQAVTGQQQVQNNLVQQAISTNPSTTTYGEVTSSNTTQLVSE